MPTDNALRIDQPEHAGREILRALVLGLVFGGILGWCITWGTGG